MVGADSASAAIMFAGLSGLATVASPTYVALAGMTALIVGAFLLLARILRLGFLADFLSRTVLIGFLTGVGIQVACGQFSGCSASRRAAAGPIEQVVEHVQGLEQGELDAPAPCRPVKAVTASQRPEDGSRGR